MRYIIHDSKARKQRAEATCRRINEALGFRAADPLYEPPSLGRRGAYTGEVILSERGAAEVARIAGDNGGEL